MEEVMKKAIVGLLTLCVLFVAQGTVSQADGTADTVVNVKVNAASGSYVTASNQKKYNTTKVYVYLTTTPSSYVFVQTWGDRGIGSFQNETVGTTAKVKRGVQSSITNNCTEHRVNAASYVHVKLQLKSETANIGSAIGKWSPDSTRNYTVVN